MNLKQKIKTTKKISPKLKNRLLEVYDQLTFRQREKLISMLFTKKELFGETMMEIKSVGNKFVKNIREYAENLERKSNPEANV